MIIYQIKNKINGMRYIGQTTGKLIRRWWKHCHESNCQFLYRSIQKYGKENFSIEIIDHGESIDDLNNKEEFWIKFLETLAPNGYNLETGGGNKRLSDETKDRLSKVIKERSNNPEYIKKLSESRIGEKNHMFGKTHTPESRKKISDALRGRHHTEESKIKMSNSSKGKKKSKEHSENIGKTRRGEKHPLFGKHHTKEARKKMSESHKGKKHWNHKSNRAKRHNNNFPDKQLTLFDLNDE